jgi:copper chaperone CopZ
MGTIQRALVSMEGVQEVEGLSYDKPEKLKVKHVVGGYMYGDVKGVGVGELKEKVEGLGYFVLDLETNAEGNHKDIEPTFSIVLTSSTFYGLLHTPLIEVATEGEASLSDRFKQVTFTLQPTPCASTSSTLLHLLTKTLQQATSNPPVRASHTLPPPVFVMYPHPRVHIVYKESVLPNSNPSSSMGALGDIIEGAGFDVLDAEEEPYHVSSSNRDKNNDYTGLYDGSSGRSTSSQQISSNCGTKENLRVKIEGMRCASCVLTIQQSLMSMDGVEYASVVLLTKSAKVVFNSTLCGARDVFESIEALGYSVTVDSTPTGYVSIWQYYNL